MRRESLATNVWRLFQSLELKSSDQIAIYDDGVGTSSFKRWLPRRRIWLGPKRNVRNTILCRIIGPATKYMHSVSAGAASDPGGRWPGTESGIVHCRQ